MIKQYPLVNKVLSYLSIRDKLFSASDEREYYFLRPFITVAREPGSGGAPIAKAVAEKINFEFIDEQIIDQIANSTQKRKAIIKAVDEKSRTKIEDIIHSTLNTEYIDDMTYISELVRVILAHAYQGSAVILGRGANFITPFAAGLHVNIVAPYDVRVQRAMDYEGHNLAKAKKVIAKVEKERKDFVKQYFRKDLMSPMVYDLTINTACWRVKEARDIIIKAFYKKFPSFKVKKLLMK